eukprot:m.23856 g.23856  ORF g.23856 m.23856 type:complete len:72 (-) comp6001_c0_seq1:127-342(-)
MRSAAVWNLDLVGNEDVERQTTTDFEIPMSGGWLGTIGVFLDYQEVGSSPTPGRTSAFIQDALLGTSLRHS